MALNFRLYGDKYDYDYNKKNNDCCRFILNNADTVLAANYLTHEKGFLYAQAIKDNFDLPCSIPDEDESREMEFYQIICKIAKRDIPFSLYIWSWFFNKFLPYLKYDDYCTNDLSSRVISNIFDFPKEYKTKLVRYMDNNPNFLEAVMMSIQRVIKENFNIDYRSNFRDISCQ